RARSCRCGTSVHGRRRGRRTTRWLRLPRPGAGRTRGASSWLAVASDGAFDGGDRDLEVVARLDLRGAGVGKGDLGVGELDRRGLAHLEPAGGEFEGFLRALHGERGDAEALARVLERRVALAEVEEDELLLLGAAGVRLAERGDGAVEGAGLVPAAEDEPVEGGPEEREPVHRGEGARPGERRLEGDLGIEVGDRGVDRGPRRVLAEQEALEARVVEPRGLDGV